MSTKSVKRKFEWILSNVTREKLETPKFSASSDVIRINIGDNKTEWKLEINMKKLDNDFFMSLYLNKTKLGRFNLFLREIFHVKFSAKLGDIARNFEKKSDEFQNGWGWQQFINLDKLFDPTLKYLDASNRITLCAQLELFYPRKEYQLEPCNSFCSDYYGDIKFVDFTLKSSDDKEFQVHRMVLANQSSFFNKMFTVDMKEKKAGSAVFEDIESKILEEVLRFLYIREANIIDYEITLGILNAAEKFEIPSLKLYCEENLLKVVKKENVLEIFEAADMFNACDLEEKCLQIIIDNYDALEEDVFDEWSPCNDSFMKKIMRAFATDRKLTQFTLQTSL